MKQICIVGKKNVGKSSLFNFLSKTNNAVSINYHGYTRDCISSIIKLGSNIYNLIDTPGIGEDKDDIDFISLKKAWTILKESDLIIYLSDINSKLFLDYNFLNIFNRITCGKIYVLNKIDLLKNNCVNNSFIKISVKTKFGLMNLINSIDKFFITDVSKINRCDFRLNLSIFGKQNVGKSSFFNKLIAQDKSIVFNKCGTTRDFISFNILKDKKHYNIFDTPGFYNERSNSLNNYFLNKIFKFIDKSDCIFLILDIMKKISFQDLKVINYCIKIGKSIIIVFNKVDLVDKNMLDKFILKYKFTNFLLYFFVSSKYNIGIKKIFYYLNKINFLKKNFNFKNFFYANKIIFDAFSINKFVILSYYPIIIDVYINKNILYSDKRYLISILIKKMKLKSIPFRIRFKAEKC